MMKVTIKGQVTIPRHVRRHLGVSAHDEVDFVVLADRVELRKAASGKDLFMDQLKALRGSGNAGMTTEEIMKMTRGEE